MTNTALVVLVIQFIGGVVFVLVCLIAFAVTSSQAKKNGQHVKSMNITFRRGFSLELFPPDTTDEDST